ncbi:mannose-1-phosphate guanylyltransferase/mannose-6-phosphate isomerase [Novispirillum sp. DQ9]|uniref:mannose-1-phosphate guanylyltransferase/mannose-6-phosphate isomerase n=1 Tax=Novispirillum sp. DQ9 TaxID=3398612 RepID=UPI003C7CDCFA
MTIHPVILCGGVGSRLWPVSREGHPKQFLPLAGDRSMLQETAARVAGPGFAPPLLVTNEDHRFIVAEQMRARRQVPGAIILEPAGRGTAPAICLAALQVSRSDPAGLLLVMPSDHVITDTAAFAAALETAARAAATGALVTFGITPDRPETGYGYIRAGAPHPQVPGCALVAQFVEKPDRATAEGYVAAGGYAWNSGIFLFRADAVLAELDAFAPAVVSAMRAALDGAEPDRDFLRPATEPFAACPSAAIDTAVMERTAKAVVVPVSMGWSDVGGWAALWDLGAKDAAGNVVRGDAVLHRAANCYVHSDGGAVAALVGVEDLVVVVTDDAVLVADRDHAQDVKAVVERLKAAGRTEADTHTTVQRPWGSFRRIDHGGRFQVKHITVTPGAAISLQLHHHRAEHWIVVEGTARVTRGQDSFLLAENESTYIPPGVVHRLENPGVLPLSLIEVQSGGYLGEDDIVRFEDSFGRR